MDTSLPIINLAEAKFECTYGRGCEGICCQSGHPILYPEEIERINANLSRFLPLLRPQARKLIEKKGFATQKRGQGFPMVRRASGWCVFFNNGCVLHQAGEAEGDRCKFKPVVCSLFPIQLDKADRWYVRQKEYKNESWDLFCLDPTTCNVTAAESLQFEIALAKRLDDEEKAEP